MYKESGADKFKVINVDADVNSYILTDLATWTQYKIWLLAFTSVGDGPKSTPILVNTEEDGRQLKNNPIFEMALGYLITCFLNNDL